MTLRRVPVALGERSYDVVIGPGALGQSVERLREIVGGGQAAIVADDTVWAQHGHQVSALLDEAPVITVPPGEGSKSFASFERVAEALLAANVGRDGTVIAFGGGVVGDLAGFAAATLRRGCRFVQIPTTLLAMVDSSVGGKTAINARAGKNLVGAFYQPALVVADTSLLHSLPSRELRAGYAEILKYGFLGNRAFADYLETNGKVILDQSPDELAYAIEVSVQEKARIVAADEREKGERALLNLGHTFGHALEAAAGYDGRLLHGEGVAVGMTLAARFSADCGMITEAEAKRVERMIADSGLPTRPQDIPGLITSAAEQRAFMQQDKKVEAGQLRLVLLEAIGAARLVRSVDETALMAFLTTAFSTVSSAS